MRITSVCRLSGRLTVILDENEKIREVNELMNQIGYSMVEFTIKDTTAPILCATKHGDECWFDKTVR